MGAVHSVARHGQAALVHGRKYIATEEYDLSEASCVAAEEESSDDGEAAVEEGSEASAHHGPRAIKKVLDETSTALERERRFTMDLWAIASNQMWLNKPVPPLHGPSLPPLSCWKEGRSNDDGTAAGWPGAGNPWPAGVGTIGRTQRQVVFAFLSFAWHLRGRAARLPLALCVVVGVVPAFMSVVMGRAIDVVTAASAESRGSDEAARGYYELCACAFGFAVLYEVKAAAGYNYQTTVPLASLRGQMRQVWQRELLARTRVGSDGSKRVWPAGTCAGLVVTCVDDAVNNVRATCTCACTCACHMYMHMCMDMCMDMACSMYVARARARPPPLRPPRHERLAVTGPQHAVPRARGERCDRERRLTIRRRRGASSSHLCRPSQLASRASPSSRTRQTVCRPPLLSSCCLAQRSSPSVPCPSYTGVAALSASTWLPAPSNGTCT